MSKREAEVEESPNKKLDDQFNKEDPKTYFNQQVWDEGFQNDLTKSIAESEPYRWGTITSLVDDTLLRQVRKEVLSEIAFTRKETDIYRVFQSGDLANLSGLDWDDLSRLPSLFKLRAAIYSEEFRDVISKVTGCGKLSGIKTDMSVNTYTKGCHLLTHDDVIGSRRVSFILYLPDPDRVWKAQYGGALKLFPAIVPNVPKTDFHCKLVPQFNQIALFTVQPGLSFHEVEEVREDKQRLSIQGWFHIPQEGEKGYIPGEQEATEARSTLQQLQSKDLEEYDFPKPVRNDFSPDEIAQYRGEHSDELSASERAYLGQFLNSTYLEGNSIAQLQKVFAEESVVEIRELLNETYAGKLREQLRRTEMETKAPASSHEIVAPWKCAVPPHKQRFMYMDGRKEFEMTPEGIKKFNQEGYAEMPDFKAVETAAENGSTDQHLAQLAQCLQSRAFKKWLSVVTSLSPTSEQVLVRRFRPGHDFTLATKPGEIAREGELDILLEATLNLTPSATVAKNWESGEYGGYEMCMDGGDADDEDDPAVYKASDEDDGVLYTSQCKWNSMTLMLRDSTVLKFVKYVSINAKGSRWDISCVWNVRENVENSDEEKKE